MPLLYRTTQYYAHHESKHLETIKHSSHFSAWNENQMAWFIVFDYWLFGNAFIWNLRIQEDYRRKWIWSQLAHMCESACEEDKIFISTQQTNINMQGLLEKLWYTRCWAVQFLNEDPNDDELFFFKKVI